MEQVVKFWNTVTNIGVEEGDSSIESVKVRLLNQIALIGFFTSVFFSIIYSIIQVDFPAVIAVCIGYTLELGVFYFRIKKGIILVGFYSAGCFRSVLLFLCCYLEGISVRLTFLQFSLW